MIDGGFIRGGPVEIPVSSLHELRAKLEAGHRVEWEDRWPDGAPRYNICQKRGAEYVHVASHTQKQARYDWKHVHQRGYIVDNATRRRVAIPGAR